ncbi:MAG: hypothetical protein NUV99_07770 [Clostridia bacterium]|nr:hypothetical protein [Clostridia bacterium]
MDSLTDVLKQLLFQCEPRSVTELLPAARQHLGLRSTPARLEKDVRRCLQKNPAFREVEGGLWSLNLEGRRENDAAYQVLKKEGRPLRLGELNEHLARQRREEIREERQLVRDGRFLRLKGGRWLLVPWEVVRAVESKELEHIIKLMEAAAEPPTLEQISAEVLGVGWRETNLLQCLEEDQRFTWVGGNLWWLRSRVPRPDFPGEEDPLDFLWEGESSALQGAELMLTFQDTDPNLRRYILSSRDLRLGILRVVKRLERMFAHLPGVAFLKLATPSGPLPVWYFREAQVLMGLGSWFESQELVPGSKLELRRVTEGDEPRFQLRSTGEREPEVYAEAKRAEQVAALREQEDLATWPLERLLEEILTLFSEGLAEDTLLRLVEVLRPEAAGKVVATLAAFPFFDEISPGTWYFNQTMKQAYDRLNDQVRQAREELEQQRREVAASREQARALAVVKRDLEAELETWRRRAEELEAELEEAQARCQELEQEKAEIRAEMERVMRRREQMRGQLAQAEEEINRLQAEKEALEGRVEQLENRVLQLQGSFNKNLSRTQAEQAALKQKLAETEKRLQGALVANQELQRLLAQLQEERLELKRQLAPWPVRLAVAVCRLFGLGRGMAVDYS